MEDKSSINDKLTKVCICRGISKFIIKESIKEGASSVDEVREKTGATTGSCKGSRCRSKIEEMLKEV